VDPGATDDPRRGRGLPLIAALLVLAIGAIAAVVVSQRDDSPRGAATDTTTSSTLPALPDQVAQFSGTGDDETASFAVEEGWEILWESSGTTFKLGITGDQDFGTVVDHEGEGGGSTSPVGSGTFRLLVTADGPWNIRIVNHSG
jgi:hypothetical protein